jgi:hypothetical protein
MFFHLLIDCSLLESLDADWVQKWKELELRMMSLLGGTGECDKMCSVLTKRYLTCAPMDGTDRPYSQGFTSLCSGKIKLVWKLPAVEP